MRGHLRGGEFELNLNVVRRELGAFKGVGCGQSVKNKSERLRT